MLQDLDWSIGSDPSSNFFEVKSGRQHAFLFNKPPVRYFMDRV